MRRVFVVGPVPPPVQGMSFVTRAVADAVATEATVVVLDLSGDLLERSWRRHLRRIASFVPALIRYAATVRRTDVTYVAVDQGLGRLFDLGFVVVARLRRSRVVEHHHSYSYLLEPDRLAALLARAAPAATHVFLCSDQARRYAELYGPVDARIVSNACFRSGAQLAVRSDADLLTIGMFGNLTRHKGVDVFLALAASCQHLPVRFVAAGPAEDDVRAQLSARPDVEWLGPVYGDDKERFLASLDVLVFPSRYNVETQPMVVFETAAHGAVPIAVARGCIRGDVETLGGVVVDDESAFVPVAEAAIRALVADRTELERRRAGVADRYRAEHARASSDLHELVGLLTGSVS